MTLGEKILALRKSRGWSQEQLADELNVSRQSVSKWELGEAAPELDKIVLLSKVFSVSTDELLNGKTMSSQKPSHNPDSQVLAQIVSAIKRNWYKLGYLLTGWGVFALVATVFVGATWKRMLFSSPIDSTHWMKMFDSLGFPLPEGPIEGQWYFLYFIGFISLAAIIGGIAIVIYGKKKRMANGTKGDTEKGR